MHICTSQQTILALAALAISGAVFWIHLSPYFVASEPNDLITKCGNGVPTAKISMGTPFPCVPTGNEHCRYPYLDVMYAHLNGFRARIVRGSALLPYISVTRPSNCDI